MTAAVGSVYFVGSFGGEFNDVFSVHRLSLLWFQSCVESAGYIRSLS